MLHLGKALIISALLAVATTGPLPAQVSVTAPNPYPLPAFALPTIPAGGAPLTSSYFEHRIGVIEFWFPRCEYCGPMHDALARVAQRYGPDSVRILAVDTDREASREEALSWLQEHSATPFPVVLDSTGLADSLHVYGAPFFAVVDHHGRVVHWLGGVDLDKALPPVLARYLAARAAEPSAPR
jgi:thiol-disulfide isomerase/thioredoxin